MVSLKRRLKNMLDWTKPKLMRGVSIRNAHSNQLRELGAIRVAEALS